MTGGIPEASGETLTGYELTEWQQRQASRLTAGHARDIPDFCWLPEAADLPASREFLAEVRALPRAGAA